MSDSKPISQQTHAIVVAAGRGERSGLDVPKQFQKISGKAMVWHSVATFLSHSGIDKIWVVIGPGQEDDLTQALSGLSDYIAIPGGETRRDSVKNGLDAINAEGGAKAVFIHDAARPHIDSAVINRLLAALQNEDGVIPVLPTVDTVISLRDGYSERVVDRSGLWRVQTPQAFDFQKIYRAHLDWPTNIAATDDAQIFQAAGYKVATVAGDENLQKYTLPSDFTDQSGDVMHQIRTGMGYDVHRLAVGEELWLGGIKIEHESGLVGHSDADVLLHALTDALLGALGAGDIGDHFPPSDPRWRGAASCKFVEFAAALIAEKSGQIQNIDMTIICEAPKIKPHRETIRQNIAEMLTISLDKVSVKATTTEGLGFAGRKEGIAAQAIATIALEV